MKSSPSRNFVAKIAIISSVAVFVRAATIEWSNVAGGDWSTPSNWTGGVVPGSADIGQISTTTVTNGIITNSVADQTVTSIRDLTAGNLTLGSNTGNKFLIRPSGDIRAVAPAAGLFTVAAPIVFTPANATSTANVSFISSPATAAVATAGLTVSGSVSAGTTSSTSRLTLNGSGTAQTLNVVSGLISDGGAAGGLSLLKTGAGNWTVSNVANTFSGGVNIDQGGLWVPTIGTTGSPSALGTGGTITLGNTNGAVTFVYTGAGETSNKNFALSGSESLVNSVLTAPGAVNIYAGGTGALNLTSNITVTGTNATTVRSVTFRGNGNVSFANTLSGNIVENSNTTNITKLDGNIWVFSGTNNYAGTTNINAGVLVFGKTASLYNGVTSNWTPSKINLTGTSTLGLGVGDAAAGYFDAAAIGTLLDGSHMGQSTASAGLQANTRIGFDTTNATGGTFTYATALTNVGTAGATGFTKLGTGTLILGGTNTYAGATQVIAGTLLVNGSIGAGAVTVTRGTLGGSGTINGATTVTSNGALDLGTAPSAITFASTLTLNGATTLNIQGATRGTGYDGVNVGGTLTYGGTLNLVFATTLIGGETFNLFSDVTGANAPATGGHFGNILLSGSGYDGTLVFDSNSNTWSGLGINGLDFTFTEASGILAATSAIPEPSTYAAIVGALALGFVAYRRRRTR